MECKWCNSACMKAGKQKTGVQKYRCKSCRRYQQFSYRYNAYKPEVHEQFIKFRTFGVSHSKMAEFLEISFSTLQKWISKAKGLGPNSIFPTQSIYDVDELKTYYKIVDMQ